MVLITQLNGKVTYSYMPETWSQEEFLRLGGFTVVFLNYNKAAFIEKSVASALAQDFPLCEMFFMDDASTDGSGDTMERLVREYRGRHKVTVVRNDENQHICGQWNIVSKLATGNWFGMFCGDDVAYVDRVSRIAEIIRRQPTLRGVCTGASKLTSTVEGMRSIVRTKPGQSRIMEGTESADDFVLGDFAFGATAFWHRSLFDRPLEDGPLDDVMLFSVLYFKNRGVRAPVWCFDRSIETIAYSESGGVSTSGKLKDGCSKLSYRAKVQGRRYFRRINMLYAQSYSGLICYFRKNGYSESDIALAQAMWAYRRYCSQNAFMRLCLLPVAIKAVYNTGNGRLIVRLRDVIFRLGVKELVGIYPAALFDVLREVWCLVKGNPRGAQP